MSDLIVFVGPTLSLDDARAVLDADYRPPVAQGDVYCAARERPWGIAIIDGYFERMPAVWHKEILWALSRGVHVFGASSMGALRACELASFGMRGVGAIFEAFRDGRLTDDDEVTLVHADATHDYRPLSTALVDLRATLALAEERGVLDAASHASLLELAKQRHYSERSYPQLCEDARLAQLDPQKIERLTAFCRTDAVQAKRDDALLLLRNLSHWRVEHPEPNRPNFTFEHTNAWQQLTQRFVAHNGRPDEVGAQILEELRLQPERYQRVHAAALTRKLARGFAAQQGMEIGRAELSLTITEFRHRYALYEVDSAERYWSAQGIDRQGFEDLMQRESVLKRVDALLNAGLDADMLDELRSSDAYPELARRVAAKRARLMERGFDQRAPALSDAAADENALLDWYFTSFLATDPPADLEQHWKRLGYPDVYAFKRALVREAVAAQHA